MPKSGRLNCSNSHHSKNVLKIKLQSFGISLEAGGCFWLLIPFFFQEILVPEIETESRSEGVRPKGAWSDPGPTGPLRLNFIFILRLLYK